MAASTYSHLEEPEAPEGIAALANWLNEKHEAEQAAIAALRVFVNKFPPRMVENLTRESTIIFMSDIRDLKHALDKLNAVELPPAAEDDTQRLSAAEIEAAK